MHLPLQRFVKRLLFLLQGAGICVEEGGEAVLTNSNVFQNACLNDDDKMVSALHLNLPTGSSSAALL